MAKILLIETASEVCSAAIAVDGQVVAHQEDPKASSHAALLTVQIDTCSKISGIPMAALDAVAVSQGPGAYTSLRVGASVAKGICYALDKPLIAIDTLLALAGGTRDWYKQQEKREGKVFFMPALDARRQEIWTALYDADLQLLAPAQPLILENNSFEDFVAQAGEGTVIVSGNGTEKTGSGRTEKGAVDFTSIRCSALHLAFFAELFFQKSDFQDVAYFEPFYMKAPNITTPNNPIFLP